MDVHGNLDLLGNKLSGVVLEQADSFPLDPKPGRFLMIKKVLYVCVSIDDGIPVWIPLTKQLNLLKYIQDTPALEWTIAHPLNTSYPLVQIFDQDGNVIIPDNINCSTFNRVIVSFLLPVSGVAILQSGDEVGNEPVIYAFEKSFESSTTWTINHFLGYNPVIRCVIGTEVVQPSNITFPTLQQAVVTWSSPQAGTVRCI